MRAKPLGARKVAVNITMDGDLLNRLDQAAAEGGFTRSELIRRLVEEKLAQASDESEEIEVGGRRFTARVSRDRYWWIGSVQELPGCGSQGRTREELRDMLADAIEGYLAVQGDLPRHAAR